LKWIAEIILKKKKEWYYRLRSFVNERVISMILSLKLKKQYIEGHKTSASKWTVEFETKDSYSSVKS
jgi:HD-GYP domain-containing protein (c-di-GMP phosphodiesterase class II)